MAVDDAIENLNNVLYAMGCRRNEDPEYIRAREALIKAVREEALTKFANDLRESLLKT